MQKPHQFPGRASKDVVRADRLQEYKAETLIAKQAKWLSHRLGIDKVLEGDVRFFRRKPWRSHRIRIASRPEIEVGAMLTGAPVEREADEACFMVVRWTRPDTYERVLFVSAATNDVDVPEEAARWCFEHFVRLAPIRLPEEYGRAGE